MNLTTIGGLLDLRNVYEPARLRALGFSTTGSDGVEVAAADLSEDLPG
jgi:hypothetical protein